jgi:hypothetical protein
MHILMISVLRHAPFVTSLQRADPNKVHKLLPSIFTKKEVILYWLIKYLIPWSGLILEKLIIAHLFHKLSAIYGTRRFITVFIFYMFKIHFNITLSSSPRSSK